MHHGTQTESLNHKLIPSPDKRRGLQARKPAPVNGCVCEQGDYKEGRRLWGTGSLPEEPGLQADVAPLILAPLGKWGLSSEGLQSHAGGSCWAVPDLGWEEVGWVGLSHSFNQVSGVSTVQLPAWCAG